MSKYKKTIYLFLASLVIVALSSQTTLASALDISGGIMPGSPLYQLDLQVEKIQLYTKSTDEGQAKLHLAFGTERLNEMDYLAGKEELEIEDVIDLSTDYQDNINEFSKLVSNNEKSSETFENISPQIEELQVIQSKVVEKINQKPTKTEVKIIVKSTIQESQSNIIDAVQNAKKPVVEKINVSVGNDTGVDKDKETVKKIDETLSNLTKQKEQLKEEIKIDEDSLKSEKQELKESGNQNPTNDITDENSDPNIISESNTIIDISVNTNSSDSPATEVKNEDTNSASLEWYYSPTCDYISNTKGKDPICGEDMLAVSSLPPEHSFFAKYTLKDGKYVQNVDDIIAKEEQEKNQIINPVETVEVDVVTETTTETAAEGIIPE